MLLCKRVLPLILLIIFYLQLRHCYADYDADSVEIYSSTYTISCAARKDISPCTCYQHGTVDTWIKVICQKMTSFNQIIQTLRNKIERTNQIQLSIEFSDLEDLSERKFSDIDTQINSIGLKKNKMPANLSTRSFENIHTVTTLTLIESKISEFPGTIFQHMPNVEVVTIERTVIQSVSPADFKSLTKLKTLVISLCNLTYIESNTFPQTLQKINLGMNNIVTLNHTLRNNTLLDWVILSHNSIDSLEGQLPDSVPNHKLNFLDISFNALTKFPRTFLNLHSLNSLNAGYNAIQNLDGVMSNKQRLNELDLTKNRIEWLASNEFESCGQLIHLNLSYNEISSLNSSLLPLQSLEILNLKHNNLMEFSLYEVVGLKNLISIDVTYNKLRKFTALSENETEITLQVLELQFNDLELLEGSMAGVKDLKMLNLSNNRLSSIPSEFLGGLTELQKLDVSHNQLLTLHDIAKTKLPSLGALYATHNEITELSQHPESKLSSVCFMYLQNNKIKVVKTDFADKNQCVYQPGVNYVLYVYLDGNNVLCTDDIQETINSIESRNNTKIIGQCSKLQVPNEELKYNVGQSNNTDSSAITVVTLEH